MIIIIGLLSVLLGLWIGINIIGSYLYVNYFIDKETYKYIINIKNLIEIFKNI